MKTNKNFALPGIMDTRVPSRLKDQLSVRSGESLEYVVSRDVVEPDLETEFTVLLKRWNDPRIVLKDNHGKYVFESSGVADLTYVQTLTLPPLDLEAGDYQLVVHSRQGGRPQYREIHVTILPPAVDSSVLGVVKDKTYVQSPDGTWWCVTLDNDGEATTSKV